MQLESLAIIYIDNRSSIHGTTADLTFMFYQIFV